MRFEIEHHAPEVGEWIKKEIAWGQLYKKLKKIKSFPSLKLYQPASKRRNNHRAKEYVWRAKSLQNACVKKKYRHKLLEGHKVHNRNILTPKQHLKILASPRKVPYDPHCKKRVEIKSAPCTNRIHFLSSPKVRNVLNTWLCHSDILSNLQRSKMENILKNPYPTVQCGPYETLRRPRTRKSPALTPDKNICLKRMENAGKFGKFQETTRNKTPRSPYKGTSPDRAHDISKDVGMNQNLLHNAIRFSNFLRDMPKQKLDWPELYLSNHILNKLSATNYVKSPGGDRKRKQPRHRKQWVGFADKCAIFVSKILQMIDSLGPSCSEIENWDQIERKKISQASYDGLSDFSTMVNVSQDLNDKFQTSPKYKNRNKSDASLKLLKAHGEPHASIKPTILRSEKTAALQSTFLNESTKEVMNPLSIKQSHDLTESEASMVCKSKQRRKLGNIVDWSAHLLGTEEELVQASSWMNVKSAEKFQTEKVCTEDEDERPERQENGDNEKRCLNSKIIFSKLLDLFQSSNYAQVSEEECGLIDFCRKSSTHLNLDSKLAKFHEMLKAYHKSTGEDQTKRVFSKAMVPNVKLPLPDVTLPELIDNVEEILSMNPESDPLVGLQNEYYKKFIDYVITIDSNSLDDEMKKMIRYLSDHLARRTLQKPKSPNGVNRKIQVRLKETKSAPNEQLKPKRQIFHAISQSGPFRTLQKEFNESMDIAPTKATAQQVFCMTEAKNSLSNIRFGPLEPSNDSTYLQSTLKSEILSDFPISTPQIILPRSFDNICTLEVAPTRFQRQTQLEPSKIIVTRMLNKFHSSEFYHDTKRPQSPTKNTIFEGFSRDYQGNDVYESMGDKSFNNGSIRGLKNTSRLDKRHLLNIKRHSCDTVCCASIKAWAKFVSDVADNARNWCVWIHLKIQEITWYASILKGELHDFKGKPIKFNSSKWLKFIKQLKLDIVRWRHYNAHVQDLTEQIMDHFHGKQLECCERCLSEDPNNYKNISIDHLCDSLAEAMRTTEYWRNWLNVMVKETEVLTSVTNLDCGLKLEEKLSTAIPVYLKHIGDTSIVSDEIGDHKIISEPAQVQSDDSKSTIFVRPKSPRRYQKNESTLNHLSSDLTISDRTVTDMTNSRPQLIENFLARSYLKAIHISSQGDTHTYPNQGVIAESECTWSSKASPENANLLKEGTIDKTGESADDPHRTEKTELLRFVQNFAKQFKKTEEKLKEPSVSDVVDKHLVVPNNSKCSNKETEGPSEQLSQSELFSINRSIAEFDAIIFNTDDLEVDKKLQKDLPEVFKVVSQAIQKEESILTEGNEELQHVIELCLSNCNKQESKEKKTVETKVKKISREKTENSQPRTQKQHVDTRTATVIQRNPLVITPVKTKPKDIKIKVNNEMKPRSKTSTSHVRPNPQTKPYKLKAHETKKMAESNTPILKRKPQSAPMKPPNRASSPAARVKPKGMGEILPKPSKTPKRGYENKKVQDLEHKILPEKKSQLKEGLVKETKLLSGQQETGKTVREHKNKLPGKVAKKNRSRSTPPICPFSIHVTKKTKSFEAIEVPDSLTTEAEVQKLLPSCSKSHRMCQDLNCKDIKCYIKNFKAYVTSNDKFKTCKLKDSQPSPPIDKTLKDPEFFDTRHKFNLTPHISGLICFESVKKWGEFMGELADSAKLWCAWIHASIKKIRKFTATIKGKSNNSNQPGSQFVVKFDKKRWIEFVTQFNFELDKWESYSKHIDHSLGYIKTTFKDHNVSPSCPKCLSNESQFESLNVGELVHSLADAMRTTIYWRQWLKSMVDEAIFLRDLANQNGLSPTHSVSNLSDQHSSFHLSSTELQVKL